MEAKELSVVLDGVGASPKHIAFGREVYSPSGVFFFSWVLVGFGVFCLSNELYAVML